MWVLCTGTALSADYFSGSTLTAIYRSDDGGITWRSLHRPSASGAFRFSLLASSASIATIEADFRFYETTDGGRSWHLVTTDLERRQAHMLTVQAAGVATVTAGGFKAMTG